VLIQPEKRSRQKTDRRDANKLGEILWVNRHRLLASKPVQNVRRVLLPDSGESADRQLTALRKRTVARRTRVINKAWRIVQKHNLQHERPTKGIQTKRARRWLAALKLPEIDRLELDQLLAEWDMLEKHLEEVDARIAARYHKNEKAQLVSTIPGVANYSALAIGSRISQIDRFRRGASLSNFFGLAPGCRNSGNDTDRNGSITKQGSGMVRFLLGQVVIHVLRDDPWMRQWYRQVKRRRGSNVARVAVMRRLATILWSMLKHNMPYIRGGPEEFRKALEAKQALSSGTLIGGGV
jgi:transposase